MSIRLKCSACQTAFVTSDDQVGRTVACPKCGTPQRAPATAVVEPEAEPQAPPSVFVPRVEDHKRFPVRKLALAVLALLLAAGLAAVVSWPMLRRWWHPTPTDPVEVAALAYLHALTGDDPDAARRLGTVDEPPPIRSFRKVEHVPERDRRLRGSFAPIAALNARISEKYTYDPQLGRFTPKNALGPAAETLDALHDAKLKAEQDELARKIASGNPDDLFDAAEGLGKTFTKLAEGALAPRKLLPTYSQLVEDAKPPLPPTEKELALDFGDRRATWDALLKRPVLTLKSDGPFIYERAEVRAEVVDKLASLGDPPTTLRLELVRFRLDLIDTGWKVISARRDLPAPETPPAPAPPPRSYESGGGPK